MTDHHKFRRLKHQSGSKKHSAIFGTAALLTETPMTCSHCQTEIEQRFCPKCGQMYRDEKLTMLSILSDYINSFFSIDKSLLTDFKNFLVRPKFFVENYWNGFRGLQSSPNRILVLSTLFVGIALLANDGFFLNLQMELDNFSAPLFMLIMVVPALTLSSFLTYIGQKRTFAEHLAINCYALGFWLIFFVPLSLLINSFHLDFLASPATALLLVLPFIWVARILYKKWWVSALLLLLNVAICSGFVWGIFYFLKMNSSQ